MVTIFTLPKPFTGPSAVAQRNAIESWLRLKDCEILLMGNDAGVKEAASEYRLTHVGEVAVNEYGTPLLDSAFSLAVKKASHDILAFVNADILLTDDFMRTIASTRFPRKFLAIGRRRDIPAPGKIEFTAGWERRLAGEHWEKAPLHNPSGMDYFIFPRDFDISLPPFAVGRQGWDNWFIWQTRTRGIPVIDATGAITAIHQNHNYGHSRFAEKTRVGGPETKHNFKLAGNFTHILTIRDADWVIEKGSLRRPGPSRRLWSLLSLFYPWQLLLAWKRELQSKQKQ